MDRLRYLLRSGRQSSKTWNSFRAAGREETKNPPCQSARRVSENLLGNSKSSLAVFYVEQVALNRHVLSVTAKRLTRRNRSYIVYARVGCRCQEWQFATQMEPAGFISHARAQHAAPPPAPYLTCGCSLCDLLSLFG